jgi:hypothetical protein
MRFHLAWLLTLATLIGAQGTHTQSQGTGDPPQCPVIVVSCPDTSPFSPLTFSASVSGPDPTVKPTFTWAVSAAKLVSGQGTHSITVDTLESSGRTVTAVVEVGGLPVRCPHTASCSTAVIRDPSARKVGEYGGVSLKVERARLNSLAAELRKEPYAQGYILSYAGRRSWEGEASWRGERAKRYLVRGGGIDPLRVVVVDAGYRGRRAIELYIVPSGVAPPMASPTVNPDEVRITGRRRKRPVRP